MKVTLSGAIGAVFVTLTVALTALALSSAYSAAHAGTRICGTASWYGSESGDRTADGSSFDPSRPSVAMRSRGFGRRYRATWGKRSVTVVHNDYGPTARTGRRFDLSRAAAARLGFIDRGTAKICLEPLP